MPAFLVIIAIYGLYYFNSSAPKAGVSYADTYADCHADVLADLGIDSKYAGLRNAGIDRRVDACVADARR